MRPHDYLGLPWLPYSARVGLIALHATIASMIMYSKNKTRPGRQRLPWAMGIVVINFLAPCILHPDAEIVSTAVLGLSLFWLSSLKVLGWAIGRGPLMIPLTPPQFAAVAFLPITPVLSHSASESNQNSNGKHSSVAAKAKKGNARQDELGNGATAAAFDFFSKLVCLALLLAVLQKDIPRLAQEFLHAFNLYLFISILMDFVGFVSVAVLNLQVAPHFDRPFLSASLTDYWSRRWNLNTGYTMRFFIYDPICEGRLIKKEGSEEEESIFLISWQRRAVAICTSLLVSGIFHELFIIYLRGTVSGYWLAFFTVQGPLLVVESIGRRWLKLKGIAVPKVLSIPLTLGTLLLLGDMFFFPGIKSNGILDTFEQTLYETLVSNSI